MEFRDFVVDDIQSNTYFDKLDQITIVYKKIKETLNTYIHIHLYTNETLIN